MAAAAVAVSGSASIDDTTTPQHKALEWLLLDDDLQLNASSPSFEQRYSMSTFYFATTNNGQNTWINCGADSSTSSCSSESERFLSSSSECDWFGITCNGNGEITKIDIRENGLTGSLPMFIKELVSLSSSLEVLRFSKNALSSTIPTEIGQLSNLQSLFLNNNNLVGTIPTSLGNLNKLSIFSVGNNGMDGTIPGEIFHPTLVGLDLDDNNFHGTLPSEMFTSSLDLRNIDIGGNNFEGMIPKGFGNLPKIALLRINNCTLEGELPPELFVSTSLRMMVVSDNNLNGSLPDELYGATSLQMLDLSSNEFSGTVSTDIGNLKALKTLELQSNKFVGTMPSTLGLLSNLETVYVSFNLFNGTVPEEVCDLRNSSAKFTELVADCNGTLPRVTCTCCSACEVGL